MPFKLSSSKIDKLSFNDFAGRLDAAGDNKGQILEMREGGFLRGDTLTASIGVGDEQKRKEAVRLVYDKLDATVGRDACNEIMAQHGISKDDGSWETSITIAQTQAIAATVKLYTQVQADLPAAQRDLAAKRASPLSTISLPPASVADLQVADKTQIRIADAGSGGAIIIPKAVAKVEPPAMATAARETQQVAAAAFGGDPDNSPLLFTPVTVLDDSASKPDVNRVIALLGDTVQDSVDNRSNVNVARHIAALGSGHSIVNLAPRVDGITLNNLQTAQKVAVLKSPDFAKDIGKTSVICPVLGLNDHLGPNMVGSGSGAGGSSNISNVMLDNKSGRMVAIDYAPKLDRNVNHIQGVIAPDQAIGSLAMFVTDMAESSNKFNAKVDLMMRDAVSGNRNTPLSSTMNALLSPDHADNFIKPEEKNIVKLMVSEADRRQFAVQVLLGVVDGLEYVHEHENAIEQACLDSTQRCGLGANDGRNFIEAQEMANLRQGLGGIDFNQLRANIKAVSQGYDAPHSGLPTPDFNAAGVASPTVAPSLTSSPSLSSSPSSSASWRESSRRALGDGKGTSAVQLGQSRASASQPLPEPDLDEQIAAAEADLSRIGSQLADPSTISTSSSDARSQAEVIAELQDKLEPAERRVAELKSKKENSLKTDPPSPDSVSVPADGKDGVSNVVAEADPALPEKSATVRQSVKGIGSHRASSKQQEGLPGSSGEAPAVEKPKADKDKTVDEGKSLRSSGSWKSAKPTEPKLTVGKSPGLS